MANLSPNLRSLTGICVIMNPPAYSIPSAQIRHVSLSHHKQTKEPDDYFVQLKVFNFLIALSLFVMKAIAYLYARSFHVERQRADSSTI